MHVTNYNEADLEAAMAQELGNCPPVGGLVV